ncbi:MULTISPECIES: hypothetical protein [Pseudonocardia]|uniref:Uncharacterized protein n=2 Tax=Pseudonocardia TaxID=1847 RepID=A0A1Y2MMX8_PSEAH|nr:MULTISPECIES: hypothetical protein [Pseudonocardia]OSY36027.1 hypothetical protein BG845_05709 [Pseudonocardia autotrophica]TDN65659.1 hypothetical protein C8E95_7168 [Pseudonocardia autotrophica]BBG05809.1 hypothetical protein Pdca_70180 [Pseudonocardia autotrophica]GEC27063.1 hypothetical protein PSA01_40920 [Pseudonocardia saturnea]
MPQTEHVHDQLNRDAQFLPQTTDDQRPALRVGDVLVSAYWQPGPLLRISIDTTDLAAEFPDNPPMQVALNDALIYQLPTPDAGIEQGVRGLADHELFQQLALAEYAELYGGAGFDYPITDLVAEIDVRMPGGLERLAARFDKHDASDVVRAWFTAPDTLLAIARAG